MHLGSQTFNLKACFRLRPETGLIIASIAALIAEDYQSAVIVIEIVRKDHTSV
jgi:hypothetical protein